VPFYFGHLSPRSRVPDSQPGFATSINNWTSSLPLVPFHPRRSPIGLDNRHAVTTRGRSTACFGRCNLSIDARGAQFRIGWSRSRCTKGPVWVLIGRSRANGDKPGGGPITQGGAHLKFSNRVFLRFLVQWDRSGRPQVVRIWGKPFGCGRSAVPGQQDAKRPPSSCLRRLPVDGRLRLHTRPPTSFRFGGEMLLGR
jgi:hypothetical protein